MKRVLFFAMAVFFILTVVTGISNALSKHQGPAGSHIVSAVIFIALIITHIVVNIKAVWKYIKGEKNEAVEMPSSDIAEIDE